ncbi:hypothetical protein [Zobellella sp. An-6]|uniref:hypothetical protein n=1 Tax=Zobellella sp. An-6 TaxID=3400218 RepID=UPI004041BD2F
MRLEQAQHQAGDAAPSTQPLKADTAFVDPQLERLFTQSLRRQLENLLHAVPEDEQQQRLRQQVETLASTLLQDGQADHQQLVDLFAETASQLFTVYQQSELGEAQDTRQFFTRTGCVMAVKDAVHTCKDIYRVRAFIRGVDQAIRAQSSRDPAQPLRVLYPACGPFAPLLLPLIRHYKARPQAGLRPLRVTLIDIQEGAVQVLRNLIRALDIEDCIEDVLCMDVMDYRPDQPLDLLMLEALQRGFSREGHLSMARHLGHYLAEDALMIPERIRVRAFLNEGQAEFVDQWRDAGYTHSSKVKPEAAGTRVELGTILDLTLDSLRQLKEIRLGQGASVIECGRVQLPKDQPGLSRKLMLYCVEATTFGEEGIREYDSGICHPLPDTSVCIDFRPRAAEPDDLLLKSGDHIQFYYKLTGQPGFMPTWA